VCRETFLRRLAQACSTRFRSLKFEHKPPKQSESLELDRPPKGQLLTSLGGRVQITGLQRKIDPDSLKMYRLWIARACRDARAFCGQTTLMFEHGWGMEKPSSHIYILTHVVTARTETACFQDFYESDPVSFSAEFAPCSFQVTPLGQHRCSALTRTGRRPDKSRGWDVYRIDHLRHIQLTDDFQRHDSEGCNQVLC